MFLSAVELMLINPSRMNSVTLKCRNMQLMGISVSAVYKPPNEEFFFPADVTGDPVNVVIGDVNSHSVRWGYSDKR